MATPTSSTDLRQVQTWPELPYEAWETTYTTLHLWTQIVGKIRRVQMPWTNHSWHVSLYVSARGLTTSAIPYGARTFEIEFDFIEHRLAIRTSDGLTEFIDLKPRSVAEFFSKLFATLAELQIDITVHGKPNEIVDAIPFEQDRMHASYDPEYAHRFWRILIQVDRVFKQFRAGFIGKCSPVQFFWGSFDLAVTRFSGRKAPPHPGGVPNCPDWIVREAYSQEVSSAGFWPGNDALPHPVFYAYAYPEPAGFGAASVRPEQAYYDHDFREFLLPYAAVRQSDSPDSTLLNFLQTSYVSAADLGKWDRTSLEQVLPA